MILHASKILRVLAVAVSAGGIFVLSLSAAEKLGWGGKPSRDTHNGPEAGVFRTEVPSHPFDIILGRLTDKTATLSILTYQELEGYFVFEPETSEKPVQTPPRLLKRNEPVEIVLQPLTANTSYRYRFYSRKPGTEKFEQSAERTFHTARPPSSTFTFTITADSHLDSNTSTDVFSRTLAAARADKPDFHIDLGDTFMTEKRKDCRDALPQYLAQRYHFGQLCDSAALYLVLGNHDGESAGRPGDGADSMNIWSCLTRKRYFPNPEPDPFFTGNTKAHPKAGPLQDYYAWEWGDALFVVLDPYWFSPQNRRGDSNWSRTLGREQYDWLARTLGASKARFKFIFIHQLVGGLENQGRGGVEAAPFYEWGGRNSDGTEGFSKNRPGWPMPIHQILLKNHVTAVFHGHDHLFAKQELDGIVYQEVPQPGYDGNGRAPRSASEYGYTRGTIFGSPGYLQVTISPSTTTVDFCRAEDARNPEARSQKTRSVLSYSIAR